MVKADPSRNYYADLKVSANASENEIRKAFRTLALQYHPDRNPGKEAEFVIKFQEIQAAHEILSDATQRAKYDAERRKFRNINLSTNSPNTPRTRPPPPPRNAYTHTPSGSYYRAPPPKPTAQSQRPPPPQHHDTFNSGADRFTSRIFRQPPTAQRQGAKAKDAENRANFATAWQKMKQNRGEENRQQPSDAQGSSPNYFQNNPNGVPFGRGRSTRMPPKQGFNPSAPGADEGQARSAYRNYARPAPSPPSATTPPPNSSQPARDTQTNEVPYSEANRTRTPYYYNIPGERTSMFEGLGRSASVRNSPTHLNRPSPSQDDGAFSDSGRRQQRSSYGGRPTKKFPQMYSDSSDPDSGPEEVCKSTKQRQPAPPPFLRPQPQQPGASHHRRKSDTSTENVPNMFKTRSDERINMKFSPTDWHGQFESGTDYFAPNVQKGYNTRGRTSPTRGRQPQKTTGNSTAQSFAQPTLRAFPIPPPPPMPPPPSGPPPNTNFPPTPNSAAHNTKFSEEAWKETFKDPQMFYPDRKETSPRRAVDASKRPKPTRKQSVSQTQNSKAENRSDASRPKFQAFVQEPGNVDGDAMDVDSNTPPIPKPTNNGVHTTQNPSGLNGSKAMPNGSAATQSSTTAPKPPGPGLRGLSGLGKVEPFLPPQNGGLGMNNLKDTLPFPSQPAGSHPTKPNTAQKLKYPDMPVAPFAPAKLDETLVYNYLNRMEAYVKAYKEYRKSLTGHFVARDVEFEGLDDNFIHRRGETTKKLGFSSYLAKIREDEEVMETMKLAQERHIQALEQCEEVRNKAMKMYQTKAL